MKNITLQLISAIVIISLTVGIVVGAITLQRSNALLESEIDEKILSTTEKYANGLSGKFSHIEGLVDSLAGTVTATFKPTENLEKAVRHYEAQIDPVVRESISATQLAHGLYVTFNPNFAKDNYEVWYSHQGEEVKKINADFMNNKRDFSEPPEEDMKYFFAPIYAQRGTWTGPYYDKDVDLTVLSYSKGIYVDQVFVGVAGADITADTTLDLVEEMNVYSEGYAFLLDENLDAVVPPKGTIPVEKIKNEEPSGLAYYDSEGKAMVMAYAQLNNGWVLGITQPKSQAYQPIYTLKWIFGGILLIAAMIIVVVAAFFSRAFSRPIEERQSSLETQNHEKDVLLVYQSRQAKMGEMVGNITHQWKQPLNSINLIMANLQDAYQYGELNQELVKISCEKIDRIIKRMSGTISDFTDFLKPPKEKKPFEVNERVELAISLMEESIKNNGISISFATEKRYMAYGYGNEFSHVVFNILNNARDAIVENDARIKRIELSVSSVRLQGEDYVQLEIYNYGSRIDEKIIERVFEPYYTTKPPEKGTGLGLYISKTIIEQRMEGKIFMRNEGDGVRCTVMIPKARGEADDKQ